MDKIKSIMQNPHAQDLAFIFGGFLVLFAWGRMVTRIYSEGGSE